MPLDKHLIESLIRTRSLGRTLHVVDDTFSTNDDAKREARNGAAHGWTLLADCQHGGRGQHGKNWVSPPGNDIYLSSIARLDIEAHKASALTLSVGLAVLQCVEELCELEAQIKWPNDIWLSGRKCAGILVEAMSQKNKIDAFVIGIGLNVNRLHFENDLESTATSLRHATGGGHALSREHAAAMLINRMELWIDRFVNEGSARIIPTLNHKLALSGRSVRCGHIEGTLLSVSENGMLRIQTEQGIQEAVSGPLEAMYSL